MPILQKEKPSVVWASLPAVPVGLGKSSAGRMPTLQKEKTIGSVGIPARSTGGTQQKQCGQNAHTTERKNHR
jgi:hypothetical protein